MQAARHVWIGGVLAALCAGRTHAWQNVTANDLMNEIRRNDLVVRGTVVRARGERFTPHAFTQEVYLRVKDVYMGDYPHSEMRLFLNLPICLHREKAGRPALAANVGDELIAPVKAIRISAVWGEYLPPDAPDHYYTAPSFYPIRDGRVTGSPYPLSKALAKRSGLEDFERLLAEKVNEYRSARHDEYRLGRVLFFDDFDDHSLAGWTFLVGHRGNAAAIDSFYGEKWVGPGLRWKHKYPRSKRGTRGRLNRDKATGNYGGVLDGARLEIGVYNGRFRLRCNRLWHHVTVVAGDPNWQDYQVECDVYNYLDRALLLPELIAQPNYQEFGLYGRVHVPNLPETKGEHSLIAVEFGPYSNELALVPMWTRVRPGLWHNFCQIRAKLPDPDGPRELSFWRKRTHILACAAYRIPPNKRIRLKARFMGNRVEGYIDGVKHLDGVLSPMPDVLRAGRMALWVFETWAEFDNVKVTELVRLNRTARE